MVFGDYTVHLGLMEHHFRHKNAIGIARSPPGEIASISSKPSEQFRLEVVNPRFRGPW
jgi:hypothetical protein